MRVHVAHSDLEPTTARRAATNDGENKDAAADVVDRLVALCTTDPMAALRQVGFARLHASRRVASPVVMWWHRQLLCGGMAPRAQHCLGFWMMPSEPASFRPRARCCRSLCEYRQMECRNFQWPN